LVEFRHDDLRGLHPPAASIGNRTPAVHVLLIVFAARIVLCLGAVPQPFQPRRTRPYGTAGGKFTSTELIDRAPFIVLWAAVVHVFLMHMAEASDRRSRGTHHDMNLGDAATPSPTTARAIHPFGWSVSFNNGL
jgi:hypothetical protein